MTKAGFDAKLNGHRLNSVIWIQTSFLGDLILTTAAIKLLQDTFGHLHQHLVTTAIGKKALSHLGILKSITVFNKKDFASSRSMHEVKLELRVNGALDKAAVVLQPHKSTRSSLLARYLGLPVITYGESAFSWMADLRVKRVSLFHETMRIALLTEPLGVSRDKMVDSRPILEPLAINGSLKDTFNDFTGRLLAIAPGSVWGTKRWPVENFCELAKRLQEIFHTGIVILGSVDEIELATQVANALGTCAPVWNLAGKTSLDDLRAIYPQLTLLVSNDSSPIHYASAFNIPTIAIFGATVSAMGFGPLAERSIVVEEGGLQCRPCSDHGPDKCPLSHFKCMRNISVERVLKACSLLLA